VFYCVTTDGKADTREASGRLGDFQLTRGYGWGCALVKRVARTPDAKGDEISEEHAPEWQGDAVDIPFQ
jgi:hypothetical protein